MSILSVFPIGTGGGGSGGGSSKLPYSVGPVSNVKFTAGIKSFSVNWTDPDDVVSTETVEWAGTKVFYKEGSSPPLTPDDGILAIDSTTRNAYTSTPLEVSGLAGDKNYAVNIFPYTKDGIVTSGFNPGWSDFVQGDILTTLNDNTWGVISKVSSAGKAANYWKVGDTKTIVINGKVGNTTFSNLSIDVFIIGFDHNPSIEGNNRIHFQIGKIIGKLIGLCDSKYGSQLTATGYFTMNTSNSNAGGWKSSYMRTTILGNNSTPINPPASTFLAALPADLRSVMKPCTKYSDNTGGGKDVASYVSATVDYLFLLAEWEYQGVRKYANGAEQNYQLQYDYYKVGNSKIHYKHNSTGTPTNIWGRSVYYANPYTFNYISTNYGNDMYFANYSEGIAPSFCV